MQTQRQDVEFDLRKLIAALMERFYIVVLCALLAGGIVAAAESCFVVPVYQSTTKLYVQAKQAEAGIMNADMQTSTMLTKDYAELIKSRDVSEQVIRQLGLELNHEQLLDRMTVSVPADTRIIEISVTDTDPVKAQEIVEAVRDTAAVHIRQVTDAETVNTAEQANLPETPVSPRIKRDCVAGGLFGAIGAVLVLIIFILRDDRIRTGREIEEVLGISTLGSIPMDERDIRKRRRKKI